MVLSIAGQSSQAMEGDKMSAKETTEFFAESYEANHIRELESQLAAAAAAKDAISTELMRVAEIVGGAKPNDTGHALSIIRLALNVPCIVEA